MRTLQRRQSNSVRARRQQQRRRKVNLFLKAFEYCQECNADIFLAIRLKDNGQISVFNSDHQWAPTQESLVGNISLAE